MKGTKTKLEEMNELRLKYVYTWKYHKETLCSYIYLKQAKMSHFSFFFYKSREQKAGNSPAQVGKGDGTSGMGEVMGKRSRRVNTVQKMCTYVYRCKNDAC
jgi:hypothetical protein